MKILPRLRPATVRKLLFFNVELYSVSISVVG